MHSLGQKCDAVGWSSFELTAPGGEELLEKIEAFCRDEGWLARGYYSRTFDALEAIGMRSIRPLPKWMSTPPQEKTHLPWNGPGSQRPISTKSVPLWIRA